MSGWIKLHRDTTEWKYFKNAEMFQLWAYLLMNAHHSEKPMFDGFGNEIKQGQFSTGRKRIANDLGINASKVERILKKLEIEHQIEQQKTTKCRIISITKWKSYQGVEQQIEQQVNNKRTTSEQQTNNKRTHNKNGKNVQNGENDKNVKNNIKPIPQAEVDANKILDFWNDKKIKRTLKADTKKKAVAKIVKNLKDFSAKDICMAMNNYENVLRSDKTYFTHEWTLPEFLDRGLEKFIGENFNYNQYVNNTKTNTAQSKFEQAKTIAWQNIQNIREEDHVEV